MQLINFKIMGETPEIPCVFQFELGKKFFVWKAPDLVKTLKSQARDLERKVNAEKRFKGSVPRSDLFVDMVAHISAYRVYDIKVHALFSTENVEELLEFEAAYMENLHEDPNCLNWDFKPYIPKWIQSELDALPQKKKTTKQVKTSEEPRKSPISNKNKEKTDVSIAPTPAIVEDKAEPSKSDFDFGDLDDLKSLAKSLKN